jgi:hypothetical protein
VAVAGSAAAIAAAAAKPADPIDRRAGQRCPAFFLSRAVRDCRPSEREDHLQFTRAVSK